MIWKCAVLFLLGWGADEATPPRGHLVIHGGGLTTDTVRQRMLELAGGPDVSVLIVPQAAEDATRSGNFHAERWRRAGAKDVSVLDLTDRQAAIELVKNAKLIWIPGGSQGRLMESLVDTGVIEAIRDRYVQGATVAGSSAGAAVMSAIMISGYAGPRDTPEGQKATFGTGLGLWPDVIVDQHFVKRKRHERLKGAVIQYPNCLGIGIDEATAVVVSGREFEVIGDDNSSVIVFDGRKVARPASAPAGEAATPNGDGATEPAAGPSETPTPIELLTLTLKTGMKFHMDKGLLTTEVSKNSVETPR